MHITRVTEKKKKRKRKTRVYEPQLVVRIYKYVSRGNDDGDGDRVAGNFTLGRRGKIYIFIINPTKTQ